MQAEQQGLVDITKLLDGTTLSRSTLEDDRQRVRWDDWAELSDRFASNVTREQLIASGRLALTPGFLGTLFRMSGLFTDLHDVYRLGLLWVGASMYRSMRFECEATSPSTLHARITLKNGYRPCESWFVNMVGCLESVPGMYGLPPAHVEWTATPLSGDYHITLPVRENTSGRFRRVVDAFRAPDAVASLILEQQQQMTVQLAALEDTETGYRILLDALPAAVALFDDEKIAYSNPAMRRALGLGERGLEGMPTQRLRYPVERFDAIADDGTKGLRELRMFRENGSTVHLEGITMAEVRFFGRTLRGLSANDVSQRVAVERRLEQSEETQRAVIDVMPDLLLRVRRDGRIVDALGGNELPEALRKKLVSGSNLETLVEGQRSTSGHDTCAEVLEALRAERPHVFECIIPDDSKEHVLEGRIVPVSSDDGSMVFLRDVTSRRDEQRQLAIAERTASVGTLAAGVAHEINNPLAAVMANLELIAEAIDAREGAPPLSLPDLKEMVRDALDGALRVKEIVANLKILSGKSSKHAAVSPLDVEATVERALSMVTAQVAQRARLRREFGHPPPVLASPEGLSQVLYQLLLNAVQATPEGAYDDHEICVRTQLDGEWVVVEISDSGSGIPDAVLPRIFDPYFTTKPMGEGNGLGLSISHRIVRELGGTLVAESSPKRGTMMRLRLPVADELPRERPSPTPRPRSKEHVAHILLIDDEPALARAIAKALGEHQVLIETSGTEAIHRLEEGLVPDLILCDLMLPGLRGPEIYQRACALAPSLSRRFVFITGGAFTPSTEEFARAHEDRVFQKPLDLAVLRADVERILAEAEEEEAATKGS